MTPWGLARSLRITAEIGCPSLGVVSDRAPLALDTEQVRLRRTDTTYAAGLVGDLQPHDSTWSADCSGVVHGYACALFE